MFSNSASLRSAFACILISALAVSAGPGLSMKVTGPDAVTDVTNLLLTVTVVNTGDQPLTLINDPQSPLSTIPTDSFLITDESGSSPDFNGVFVKYVGVDYVAANGEDEDFTVLQPGQSIDVTHDLSQAYNFTQTGEGKYTFEAKGLFYYVDKAKHAIAINSESESHQLTLNGILSAVFHGLGLRKRLGYKQCSVSQEATLAEAAVQAQAYAASAFSYLASHTSATPRYTTWFGPYNSARHSTAVSHFSAISGGLFNTFTYDCSCTMADVYAYVNPNNYGYITLCGAFWKAPLAGTDSKGGTLVHESSHFVKSGGTKDNAYGQPACKSLAVNYPQEAVNNADSHEYFAENTPALA